MRLLDPLFALLTAATDSQLARMVEYLKAENRILRAKLPTRITVTPRERARLVKLGSALGSAIKDLVTIVSPRTFARWVVGGTRAKPGAARNPGRSRTAAAIRDLVLQIAGETGWGYTRILGELKKLGIRSVCRSTVVAILKEAGLDPEPERRRGTWDQFVKRHAATLWACEFLSVKSHTLAGVIELYVLFFIHIGTRRVIVTGMSANPDAAWVAQQARNATMAMAELNLPATVLIRDHDTKFGASFDAVFESEGAELKRVGPRAPNLNAFAERWVQSLRRECLDHFVVCGERHLRHLIQEYLAHYHEERPHQGIGNVPLPDAEAADEPTILPFPSSKVECRERLGGLLRHYHRQAAA